MELIKSKKSKIAYEMGVMLYNAYLNSEINSEEMFKTKEAYIDRNGYDIFGNFLSLYEALELSLEDLRDGFIAESQNYLVKRNKAIQIFYEIKRVFDLNSTGICYD